MVRPCLVSIADQESSAETEKRRRYELRVTREREASRIQMPVPRCEYEDIRDPQGSSRYQKVFSASLYAMEEPVGEAPATRPYPGSLSKPTDTPISG